MTTLLRAVLIVAVLGSTATPARADWLLTPYLGVVFGGAANQFVLNDADDEFEQRISVGGSVGWMSQGIVGFELDYSAAPNFFQFTGGTNNFDILDLDSSVQTLMANVILAIPIGGSTGGGFRPYVTAGAGTIRTQLRSASDVFDDITSNDTGYNFGAGANLFFGDHFGLRADVRYFRQLESLDDEDPITDNPFFDQEIATDVFDFWRGTIGFTIRFGG
jgi:opacity protein-like surface antigen